MRSIKFLSFKKSFRGVRHRPNPWKIFLKWTLAKDSRRWKILTLSGLVRCSRFFLSKNFLPETFRVGNFGIDRFGFSILKFFLKFFYFFFEKNFFDFKLSWKRSQKDAQKKIIFLFRIFFLAIRVGLRPDSVLENNFYFIFVKLFLKLRKVPLDVKSFPILPNFFDASCYRVHPPAKFFFDRSEIFFDEIDSIGSFTKIFFITRCGRLLVRSLFNRWCLRKIFLFSESFFISSSSIATPNRSGTSCRRSRVPSLLGSSEPSSLSWSSHSTGLDSFQNYLLLISIFERQRTKTLSRSVSSFTFIIHSKTFHNESAVCSDPLNFLKDHSPFCVQREPRLRRG